MSGSLTDPSGSNPLKPNEASEKPARKNKNPDALQILPPLILGVCAILVAGIVFHLTVDTISIAITAVATIAIMVFTGKLTDATSAIDAGGRDTLTHLRESSQREQRAYVHVQHVKPACAMIAAERGDFKHALTAEVTIMNVGKTPAHRVTHQGKILFFPTVAPDPFPSLPRIDHPAQDVIGPGLDAANSWTYHPLTTREITSGTVIIHGKITYRDVFGRDCWTTYRWQVIDPVNEHPDTVACEDGNEADDYQEPT